MAAVYKSILACFILFVIIQHIDGLQCYTCIGCSDPFSVSAATVTTGTGYCTKISTAGYVVRSTAASCTQVDVVGNGQWCCSSDLCNSATKLISTTSIILALLFTAVFKLL